MFLSDQMGLRYEFKVLFGAFGWWLIPRTHTVNCLLKSRPPKTKQTGVNIKGAFSGMLVGNTVFVFL